MENFGAYEKNGVVRASRRIQNTQLTCDKHEQNPNEETGRVRRLAWAKEQVLAPGEVTEKRAKILKEWKKNWMTQESEGRGRGVGGIKQSMPGWRMNRIQEVKVDEDGRTRSMKIAFHTRKVADDGRSNVPKTTEVGVQNLAVKLVRDEQEAPVWEEMN